jgi:CRP-like cAMP-binding protein
MTLTATRLARAPGEDAWRRPEIPIPPDGKARTGITEHLHRLRDFSLRLRFQRNDTIFQEGDAAAQIYTLVSGCVRLCRHLPDGRRHISDFMFAGDIFGLGEFPAYPFTAESVTTATVTACPRAYFEHFSEGNARIRTDLLSHLMARLCAARQHLFVISCQNAKERMASFLLRMSERNNLYGDKLDIPMGRQDIADHLGLTIETICRAIGVLKNEGLLDVPNAHQFIVNDFDALRALAEGRNSR